MSDNDPSSCGDPLRRTKFRESNLVCIASKNGVGNVGNARQTEGRRVRACSTKGQQRQLDHVIVDEREQAVASKRRSVEHALHWHGTHSLSHTHTRSVGVRLQRLPKATCARVKRSEAPPTERMDGRWLSMNECYSVKCSEFVGRISLSLE